MKPEKREKKKPEAFDPHPPGSKHKMMAERSKVTKGKKKDRERIRNVRETAKKVVADLGCCLEPSSPSIHILREVKLSLVLNPLLLLLGALAIVRLSLLLLCFVQATFPTAVASFGGFSAAGLLLSSCAQTTWRPLP